MLKPHNYIITVIRVGIVTWRGRRRTSFFTLKNAIRSFEFSTVSARRIRPISFVSSFALATFRVRFRTLLLCIRTALLPTYSIYRILSTPGRRTKKLLLIGRVIDVKVFVGHTADLVWRSWFINRIQTFRRVIIFT